MRYEIIETQYKLLLNKKKSSVLSEFCNKGLYILKQK